VIDKPNVQVTIEGQGVPTREIPSGVPYHQYMAPGQQVPAHSAAAPHHQYAPVPAFAGQPTDHVRRFEFIPATPGSYLVSVKCYDQDVPGFCFTTIIVFAILLNCARDEQQNSCDIGCGIQNTALELLPAKALVSSAFYVCVLCTLRMTITIIKPTSFRETSSYNHSAVVG
jgi:hypothetical protein